MYSLLTSLLSKEVLAFSHFISPSHNNHYTKKSFYMIFLIYVLKISFIVLNFTCNLTDARTSNTFDFLHLLCLARNETHRVRWLMVLAAGLCVHRSLVSQSLQSIILKNKSVTLSTVVVRKCSESSRERT